MTSPITHALSRVAGQARRLLSRLAKAPKTGPITGAQSPLPTSSPFGSSPPRIPGFASVQCGAYDVYRKISSHPTVAEVMSIVKAPILSNRWVWHKLPDAPESWRVFVEQNLDPLRTSVLKDGLRALEFGCWKFEKVWGEQSGRLVLQKLKSLNVDPQFTRIRVDPGSGNFLGLEQTGANGQIIFLPANKCFLYTYDGEPGQYHGRSRHENIRKDYFRYEEVAQRLAQYLRKVAGIIVQLHYPDGTSKTANGAEFPNDWIAQQILDAVSEGRSIRFQNLFSTIASSSDLRPADMEIAARLAGESQWKLSAVDVGSGADHAQGLLDALAYYDKPLFRGWQRSERVGMEAQDSGSRADSQSHSDTGLIDSQLIEADFVQAFRTQVVDDLLTLNFGEQARGAVWPVPNAIADDSNTTQAQALIRQGLSNPQGFQALAAKIDWDTLLATANIPTDANQRGSIADKLAPQSPESPAAREPESLRQDLAFNPDQPRDSAGKWTTTNDGATNPPDVDNEKHAVCFAAGTHVLMADGTAQAIEIIAAGQNVLSAPEDDPEGTPLACRVSQVYHNRPRRLLAVTVALTSDPQVDGTIHTTARHPFYVKGKGWISAKDLHTEDEVRTADGFPAKVRTVVDTGRTEPVFNLRVEELHTYFVKPDHAGVGVLVHNDSPDGNPKLTALQKEIDERERTLKQIQDAPIPDGDEKGVDFTDMKKLIVAAAKLKLDALNERLKGTIGAYLDAMAQALEEADKDLKNVTDNKGVEEALKALEKSKIPKALKDSLKSAFESLGQGSDVVAKVSDFLNGLKEAHDDIETLKDAAGQEGNYLAVASDTISRINQFNQIRGLKEMIDFGAPVIAKAGEVINEVQNAQGRENVDGLISGTHLNLYPDAPYGSAWAKKLLMDSGKPEYKKQIEDYEALPH